MLYLGAVSYTHLDVYKRQKSGEESIKYPNLINNNWNTTKPFEKITSDSLSAPAGGHKGGPAGHPRPGSRCGGPGRRAGGPGGGALGALPAPPPARVGGVHRKIHPSLTKPPKRSRPGSAAWAAEPRPQPSSRPRRTTAEAQRPPAQGTGTKIGPSFPHDPARSAPLFPTSKKFYIKNPADRF